MLEKRGHLVAEPLELRFIQVLVDRAPPDPVLRARLADEELVFRRTSRLAPGVDHEWAALCESALFSPQRMRVEKRGGGMNVHAAAGVDSVLAEIDSSLGSDRHCHAASPFRWPKKRDPAVAGRGPYRTRAGALRRLVPWPRGATTAATSSFRRDRFAAALDVRRRAGDRRDLR